MLVVGRPLRGLCVVPSGLWICGSGVEGVGGLGEAGWDLCARLDGRDTEFQLTPLLKLR